MNFSRVNISRFLFKNCAWSSTGFSLIFNFVNAQRQANQSSINKFVRLQKRTWTSIYYFLVLLLTLLVVKLHLPIIIHSWSPFLQFLRLIIHSSNCFSQFYNFTEFTKISHNLRIIVGNWNDDYTCLPSRIVRWSFADRSNGDSWRRAESRKQPERSGAERATRFWSASSFETRCT